MNYLKVDQQFLIKFVLPAIIMYKMDLSPYKQILVKYWGHTSFRPLQEEIIRSVAEGRDTLALMPTGGGKSITFQVPALAKEGICIVISPLIALMKDQVDRLNALGIKSMAVHSGMSAEEIDIALDNCVYGSYKFLYISPERIATKLFQARVKMMAVNLVAVDEAHCISQWGYDFRPSYLKIVDLRELVDDTVPFLALTASATPSVAGDIMEKLLFKEKNLLKTSFERKNISYLVRTVDDKSTYLLDTVRKVPGSGIVYTRSRRRCKEVATMLVDNGVSAEYYHAGLTPESREKRQNAWTSGRIRVMVCTNAFGMGIDKPDVRFVIHWEMPGSIEEYFQESGRAGRDNKPSSAVLLFSLTDKGRLEDSVRKKYPPIEKIKDIYEALCNFLEIPIGSGKNGVFDFNFRNFVSKYRLPVVETFNAMTFLQKEGYLEFTEEIDNPSRIRFVVGRDELYKFQVANEKFDNFIKLVLRSYSGLFSEFTVIDEEMLSKKSGISREAVYQFLVRLASLKIISYIPGKKTSLVIFTEERLDRKNLLISPERYMNSRERSLNRVAKMIDYAEIETKCRSLMLLDYFGEEADRCGICDVCRRRNELDLSKYEFDSILDAIKRVTMNSQCDATKVVARVKYPQEKVLKVMRWLLDHDKLETDENRILRWKDKKLF